MCHVKVAAFLDRAQRGQQLWSREFRNRLRSDPREHILAQIALDPPSVAGGPIGRVLREPLGGHGLEAVPGPLPLRLLLRLAVGARVDVPGQKLAGLVAPLAGELQ